MYILFWHIIKAKISEVARLLVSPPTVEAQKRQPIRQPACDETQSVARSPSGI